MLARGDLPTPPCGDAGQPMNVPFRAKNSTNPAKPRTSTGRDQRICRLLPPMTIGSAMPVARTSPRRRPAPSTHARCGHTVGDRNVLYPVRGTRERRGETREIGAGTGRCRQPAPRSRLQTRQGGAVTGHTIGVAGNEIRPTTAGRPPVAAAARAAITGAARPRMPRTAVQRHAHEPPARANVQRGRWPAHPPRPACDQAASPERQAARRTLKPPFDARHPAPDRPVTDRADAGVNRCIVLPGGAAGQTRIVQ